MTDFRNRIGSQYDSQGPNYSRPTSSSGHPMYGQPTSLYPKIGGATAHSANSLSASGHGRNPPFHYAPSPPSSSGIGIRVAIKPEYRITPPGPTVDPVVSKYIASGLGREAVPLAVANYGDDPAKVKEFANGYTLLREMGFPSNSVAEALLMFDNDTDKALAHVISNSS
ncbi:uncharacterized protein LOC111405612 isoform X2 [Olea europaea var. sylvestris]|uniref:uncharacterized protein LOC111405612 isoform X2 n=1 Tax=Olea europaea var. sylvestris TaxID=158386 RepID=UPI000C1D34BD|nr:uncharacterized protein LOC111405612 isoform X2 [Olea europaea var. sylvestris]